MRLIARLGFADRMNGSKMKFEIRGSHKARKIFWYAKRKYRAMQEEQTERSIAPAYHGKTSRTLDTGRSGGVPLKAPRRRPTLIEHLDVAGLGWYQARLFLLLCFLPDTSMVSPLKTPPPLAHHTALRCTVFGT
jgi:hypothetical protein